MIAQVLFRLSLELASLQAGRLGAGASCPKRRLSLI